MSPEATGEEGVWPCVVCGDLTGPESRSDCYRCGEYFHLRLTTTATGPDCGDVWIDDEVMALQFACHNCLAEQRETTMPAGGGAPAPESAVVPERPRSRRASGGTSARDLARRRR